MALNFKLLSPRIERAINHLHLEYCQVPASILTESDLKFRLHQHLSRIGNLRRWVTTIDRGIRGTRVHAEVSWYDECGKLRIRPDITILEPEHMFCKRTLYRTSIDVFSGSRGPVVRGPRLPSKQFEFGGNAVTFELKFARNGITERTAGLIKKDFAKIERLQRIMDAQGEGESVFSYLVIFNAISQPPWGTPLAKFLKQHGKGWRHKIVYKTYTPAQPEHCSKFLQQKCV